MRIAVSQLRRLIREAVQEVMQEEQELPPELIAALNQDIGKAGGQEALADIVDRGINQLRSENLSEGPWSSTSDATGRMTAAMLGMPAFLAAIQSLAYGEQKNALMAALATIGITISGVTADYLVDYFSKKKN